MQRMHIFSTILIAACALTGAALADENLSCADLNRLYVDRYVSDFSIDPSEQFLNIDLASYDNFACEGTDRNFILARAIHDLDRWRPYAEGQTDFYEMLKLIFSLHENTIRYVPSIDQRHRGVHVEAQVFHDEDEPHKTAVFLTDKFFSNGKRLRPTYSLVHEARHTILHKTLPD